MEDANTDTNATNDAHAAPPPPSLWQRIRDRLSEHGVYVGFNRLDGLGDLGLGDLGLEDLENLDVKVDLGTGRSGIKVVCVAPDLQASAEELKEKHRDQVVMVRVDEETRDKLDDWVRTGAVKSRSEAAALFIREGLAVREDELEKLRDALREVESAQDRLERKAREIFGGGGESDPH